MKSILVRSGFLTLVLGAFFTIPAFAAMKSTPAQTTQAPTAVTQSVAAAAAVIIGPIYYDSNHNPFYRGNYGQRHYVSKEVADFYISHGWSRVPVDQRHWKGSGT